MQWSGEQTNGTQSGETIVRWRALVTSFLTVCFAANMAFTAVELELVASEWAFAAVCQLASR